MMPNVLAKGYPRKGHQAVPTLLLRSTGTYFEVLRTKYTSYEVHEDTVADVDSRTGFI
jgi:hypothetical protein